MTEEYEIQPEVDFNQPMTAAEAVRLVQFLTENKSMPEDIHNQEWGFSSKEATLTHLGDKEIQAFDLRREIANDIKNISMRQKDFNWGMMINNQNKKVDWNLRIRRSRQGFERKMQTTQIRQLHTSKGQSQGKSGIISRIGGGLFGLGGKK